MARMSVEELAALPGVAVGTKEAAAVLGCDRYSLTIAAKCGMLGLPHFFSGNRLKISKAALLEFCGAHGATGEVPIVPGKGVKA
ncbi:MAG: helix-turn-helix domain-containing protein [Clostridiales bacterium]|nr:helix-turn-helix domain-containing protein [Clostridiales bacterium]